MLRLRSHRDNVEWVKDRLQMVGIDGFKPEILAGFGETLTDPANTVDERWLGARCIRMAGTSEPAAQFLTACLTSRDAVTMSPKLAAAAEMDAHHRLNLAALKGNKHAADLQHAASLAGMTICQTNEDGEYRRKGSGHSIGSLLRCKVAAAESGAGPV